MGLLGKKPPCAICGGKVGFLLPTKIDGEYICSNCDAKIDMQRDLRDGLTMQGLREYMVYYEENKRLQEQFQISEKVDFGWWDTKLIFDYENHLFCMSKQPDKTIFQGAELVSFTIKEDTTPLYEGDAKALKRYTSTVPERVRAMEPQLVQYIMNKRMEESMERRMEREDEDYHRTYIPSIDISEPFHSFQVEIHLNHPYWKVVTCDMNGPTFSNDRPDVNDYIRDYQNDIEEIEKLVNALKTVAFPQAVEQSVGAPGLGGFVQQVQQPQQAGDTIEDIKKYKSLMEEGIISQEEFQEKKRQLLGI
ncbi:MAG: DUF4428 domain-containing protein [Lachnospiraceae bacterium]|nr:DUF4428 domain-containing protein [Lachnospiraceae bacterium]